MSSSLLAKLKVKPVPKAQEAIEIAIPIPARQEAVAIQTKIIDKTGETTLDRESLLSAIKMNPNFKGVTSAVPERILIKKQSLVVGPNIAPRKPPAKRELTVVEEEKTEQKESEVQPPIEAKKTKKRIVLISEGAEEEKAEAKPIEEQQPREEKAKKTRKPRITVKPSEIVQEYPETMFRIGDTILNQRLPVPRPNIKLRASKYYMNNRQIFINFITSLFTPYKQSIIDDKRQFKCEESTEEFSLLSHQNIVRDYLNLYTPYRGLLLFHGLGSGKTCSSIAIAEGMKSDKPIIVMTPASLRRNYIEELKKCGDPIYKKNQYWEFVDTVGKVELESTLARVLSLPVEFIRTQRGAWLVNVKKPSNYEELSNENKKSLDEQLNKMINSKYRFINYNGLRNSHLSALTLRGTKNPFDNSVIVIDEAHNFISRIVNKINKPDSLSYKLYELLMEASNAKIVLLTGTPIINYPNELAILFNILRGKIKSWTFKLNLTSERKFSQDTIKSLFMSKPITRNLLDDVQYKSSTATLTITRNPFGFIPTYDDRGNYDGLRLERLDERGNITDDDFVQIVKRVLQDEGATVTPSNITVNSYKALPDKSDEFNLFFIDQQNQLQNTELFKRRILGLTSYFRSIEELMPEYIKSRDYHVIKVPMSEYQLSVYEAFRSDERQQEKRNKLKRAKKNKADELYEDVKSSYRIFSRIACNFVFPPEIGRPMPKEGETLGEALEAGIDEDLLDGASAEERLNNVDGRFEADDIDDLREEEGKAEDSSYKARINHAVSQLWDGKERYLSPEGLRTYSPKFLNIFENIVDESHRGLHLIYSQFRTLEGITVLKLILEANGFAQFKIKKQGESWVVDMKAEDMGKPTFALYTGTEDNEEKEIIRNIFNSSWKYVPSTIVDHLQRISSNNFYGEIVKVLMITSAGAEGISLKNVRYVHLTESYWHPVRLEQVIGRARRICSHNDLPKELQNVKVFLYLSSFDPAMLSGDGFRELKLIDVSKINRGVAVTSDEHLYESSLIKEDINKQLLKLVKESAIDCNLNTGDKDDLRCFTFGSSNPNNFSFLPALTEEARDEEARVNVVEVTWRAREVTIDKVMYALNPETNEVYDLDSYKAKAPVKVGRLEQVVDPSTGKKKIKFIRV